MAKASLKTASDGIPEKPKDLAGRRGMLAKLLAGTVASVAYGRVNGMRTGDQELIDGIAKAEVSDQLLQLPDNVVEQIDDTNPNIGRGRRIVENTLRRIQSVMQKLRTAR